MSLHFKNILYSFDPDFKNKPDIKLDLTIEKGDIIGLIGRSGSGKSTILEIIAGLRIPQRGSLEFNSLNLYSKENKKHLRVYKQSISFVSQYPNFMPFSIADNIEFLARLTNQHNHDITLEQAANIACVPLDDKTAGNYNLSLHLKDSGANLSGGQRQRIGIARSLFKNHQFLILDEASSALDLETEAKIFSNLYKFKKNRSIILTAHRYSSLSICNKVFLVAGGEIREKYEGSDLRRFLE